MANLVEIKYRDNQIWTSVSGIIIDFTGYSRKYKGERTQPYYVLPEVIQDTFNGQTFDVQHIRHDCFYIEFFVRESELHDLSRMKSCSEIIIIEHSQINGVWNRSKEFQLDLTKSDYLEVSEPERAANTTGWKTSIIFRTNRTVINKITTQDTSNVLSVGGTPYYSIKDTIVFNKDAENVVEQWSDGSERILQTNSKEGQQILLYFIPSDFNDFVTDLKNNNTITINGDSVKEYSYEHSEVGEGLIKVVVSCVTDNFVTPFLSFSTHHLLIDDGVGTYNYYTDYSVEFVNQSPILSQYSNDSGVNTTAKSITKTAKLFRTYQTGANAFELKKRFELGGTITLDTVPVIELTEVVPEKIGVDLYRVDVNCLLETTKA